MFDTDVLLPEDPAETRFTADTLPTDLDVFPTGLMLAVMLFSMDRDDLSGLDRVSLLKARARLISHLQAEQLADIDSITEAIGELPDIPGLGHHHDVFDTTATEISAALSLTRRASGTLTDLAYRLCQRLPQVWNALSEGLIDLARARVLADQTTHLPQELARQVCETALERASTQTTGQLRARLQKLIITIDPASAKDRYEEKLAERRVITEMTDAGTAHLMGLDLSPAEANAAMRRINRIAKALKARGDKRPIDQIRADILLDLLTGRNQENTGSDKATVDIRADLSTLLGFDDNPGEIPGWGPVIADVLRQIIDGSHDGDWRFGIYEQNQMLGVVPTRRRPTAAQKRYVETRDPECVFPTCRNDSIQCDIDHREPWAQHHRTTVEELEPLCRYHHLQKHGNWKLTRSRAGNYIWTSPLGHTYFTGPDPP
jgi:hypothetical protein